MFSLEGRVAIVTGAARGNGAAIAAGLARAGAAVALGDLDAAGAEAGAAAIQGAGGRALGGALDVTDEGSAAAFAVRVRGTLGPASILVNNAGVIRRQGIDDPGFAEGWDAMMAVNAAGPAIMVRAVLGQLAETRGAVVGVGSIMSVAAGPSLGAYAASKGAVAQLTRALAHDLAPMGIRVNAVLPGVIDTPMTEATRADPEAIGRFLAHTPMRRTGRPEELVGPVVFLASEAASFVTGALLAVDGGYLAA